MKPAKTGNTPGLNYKKITHNSVMAFFRNFKSLLLITLISYSPAILLVLFMVFGRRMSAYYLLVMLPVIYVLIFFVNLILTAASSYAGYIAYTGGKIEINRILTVVSGKIFRYTVATGLYCILFMFGSALLILPGIYLLVALMFSGLAAITEKDGIKPLSFSMEIVKGNFFSLLFYLILQYLPFIVLFLFPVLIKRTAFETAATIIILAVEIPFIMYLSVVTGGLFAELKKSGTDLLKDKKTAARLSGSNDNAGCVLLLAGTLILIIAGAYVMGFFMKKAVSAAPAISPICSDTGLVSGGDIINKEMIWHDNYLDIIFDAAFSGKGTKNETLVLTANTKAFFIDKDMKTVRTAGYYQQMCRPVKIIDMENDGMPEFFKDTTREKYIVIMDSFGRKKKEFKADSDTEGYATWGDIEGDGRAEFIVNFENKGKIELYDVVGVLIHSINMKASGRVYMIDYDSDGIKELLFRDKSGTLILCNTAGVVISSVKPVEGNYTFYPVQWFKEKNKCIMIPQKGKLCIFDIKGEKINEIADEDIAPYHEFAGMTYQGVKTKGYFVLLGKSYSETVLSMYSYGGALLYKEKLKGRYQVMMNYKNGFIIAGEGRIYKYDER